MRFYCLFVCCCWLLICLVDWSFVVGWMLIVGWLMVVRCRLVNGCEGIWVVLTALLTAKGFTSGYTHVTLQAQALQLIFYAKRSMHGSYRVIRVRNENTKDGYQCAPFVVDEKLAKVPLTSKQHFLSENQSRLVENHNLTLSLSLFLKPFVYFFLWRLTWATLKTSLSWASSNPWFPVVSLYSRLAETDFW